MGRETISSLLMLDSLLVHRKMEETSYFMTNWICKLKMRHISCIFKETLLVQVSTAWDNLGHQLFQCRTHLFIYALLRSGLESLSTKIVSEVVGHFQGAFSVHCGFLSATEQRLWNSGWSKII